MITPRRFRRQKCPRCGLITRVTSKYNVCTPCVVYLEWHRPEVVR
jgi:hypothetical protein